MVYLEQALDYLLPVSPQNQKRLLMSDGDKIGNFKVVVESPESEWRQWFGQNSVEYTVQMHLYYLVYIKTNQYQSTSEVQFLSHTHSLT